VAIEASTQDPEPLRRRTATHDTASSARDTGIVPRSAASPIGEASFAPLGERFAAPAAPAPASAPEAGSSLHAPASLERALSAQDTREAMSLPGATRVSIRLDGADGSLERVRVELLGRELASEVSVDDGALAHRLRGSAGEVQKVLEQRGYDPLVTSVKLAAEGRDLADARASVARAESAQGALRALLDGQEPATRDPAGRREGRALGQESGRQNPNERPQRGNRREDR
jgi:hypothetical protein